MKDRLFGYEDPRPAAFMRIGLGLVLLWDAAFRWHYVVELYSSDGMPMPLSPGTFLSPPALPALWCVIGYSLLLFALLAVAVGWQTRLSLVIALVLCSWFGLLDIAGSFKKYSVISLHLLALLPFTQSHAVWSVDAWTHKRTHGEPVYSPRWPRMLMGLLISMIYLGAVITKIRLADFGSGDLLMFSLLDERWGGTRLGMWLSTQQELLTVMSLGTILYELAAAMLLWVPQTRRAVLVIGIVFHLSISATMHVGIFSPMMIVALGAFLDSSDLQAIRNFGRKLLGSRPSHWTEMHSTKPSAFAVSLMAFFGAASLSAMGGLYQQKDADYSGVFSGKPITWQEVPEATIEAFSEPACPNVDDYFHRVEIGSRVEAYRTFGSRSDFPRGSTVYVLARMQQKRPKLLLHWSLFAPDGQLIEQFDRPLQNWPTHAWSAFRMTSPQNPVGTYTIVLEASYVLDGNGLAGISRCVVVEPNRREVARIPFRLTEPE